VKILHFDASAGASGDMILGALVDAGVPAAHLRRTLSTLPIEGWRLISRKVVRAGVTARKIDVRVPAHQRARRWREISRILRRGDLDAVARARALAIFRRLIEAEAEVHGHSFDETHLHEVGATDAIIDVVGACAGLSWLGVERIVVSTMTTGFGTVRCAHGVYPVPAPATALLVRGCPITGGDLEMERLTPTGAAILTTIADDWGPLPAMRPAAVGYGAGTHEPVGHANLLRLTVGDGTPVAPARPGNDTMVIEFTVDDATPQVLGHAGDRLFDAGALEVYTTPVLMKKGRAGHQITVLVRPDDLGAVADTAFRETTTLGLRYRSEGRLELDRSHRRVRTRWGTIPVKIGRLGSETVQAWPEYDDCVRLSRKHGVPLKEIQIAALEAFRKIKRKGQR
jgi:uncharacterized protein (TIGR00299 family) protein